jgi:hypothetical protein
MTTGKLSKNSLRMTEGRVFSAPPQRCPFNIRRRGVAVDQDMSNGEKQRHVKPSKAVNRIEIHTGDVL